MISKKNRVVLPLATLLVLSSSFTSTYAATDTFEQGEAYHQGAYKTTAQLPVISQWTNNSKYNGSEEPGIKWRFTLDYTQPTSSIKNFISQGTIDEDGTIYVSNQDGKVRAINPDGTIKWEYDSGNIIYTGITIGKDGTLYFTNGSLIALNPDGTRKWSIQPRYANFKSTPTLLADGTIIVTNRDTYGGDYLHAINPDGTQKWKTTLDMQGNLAGGILINKDGHIYVTSNTTNSNPVTFLYAYDLDGNNVFTKTFQGTFKGSALLPNGNVLIERNGIIDEINSQTGDTVKTLQTPYSLTSSPTVGADGTIYVSHGGGLLALSSDDFSEKWAKTFKGAVSQATIDVDGTIYVGVTNEGMIALNPDGTEKWKATLGSAFKLVAPSIDKNGIIYTPVNTAGTYYEYVAFGKEREELPICQPATESTATTTSEKTSDDKTAFNEEKSSDGFLTKALTAFKETTRSFFS